MFQSDEDDPASDHGLGAASPWPFDKMPPMPLEKGLAMVRSASRELYFPGGTVDPAIDRQHITAAYEAHRKWKSEQSRLAAEAADRFWVRAKGWAALIAAAGGGSVVTLIIQRLFPA
jgi:hypothetical protein